MTVFLTSLCPLDIFLLFFHRITCSSLLEILVYSLFFEQYFGIKAYFEVISAKPTHIFYYHSRYFVFFYCFYHLLKSLSIKGCSAYSIIGIVIDIYKAVSFGIAFK